MFKELINNFLKTEENKINTLDESGMLSLAIIFIRIARLDGNFDDRERLEIQSFLKKRYKISEEEVDMLISKASEVENNLNDNVQLTKKIKDTIPLQDRFDLLRDAWKIILADGERTYQEDSFMRLFCKLLGLSDKDSAIARKDVLSE